MTGEKNLAILLKTMKPILQAGEYVFCVVNQINNINATNIVMSFKEKEGLTVIIKKELADELLLPYSYVASWITVSVHSSLEAVGLTAAISTALAKENISCNIVAAFYHDHIFVDKNVTEKAMEILNRFSLE